LSTLFRVYEPFECGADDYPRVWHDGVINFDGEYIAGELHIDGERTGPFGVKHAIREMAGHRCERCKHPYEAGTGEWGDEPLNPGGPPSRLLSMIEDGRSETEFQMRIRPPLWSDCDKQCAHGGPMRVWCRQQIGEGWQPFDPTPEACGAAVEAVSPSRVQAAWRILTVHHLNGRKHDLRWWNLAALCQRCHLYIQRKVIMERVFPFEHTEWFKPHAAGWYAYAYLGQDITRAEAVERMDELLALEHIA
jgi:hypothetical protein